MNELLPPDKLERVLPALRSVAELIRKHGALSRDHVRRLTRGIAPEGDWATAEVERWAQTLAEVRGTPDPLDRDIAVQELALRGVPDAAAELAVGTVALATLPITTPEVATRTDRPDPPPRVAPSPRTPIRVTPSAVGFPELVPGQAATSILMVAGGPGRVRARCDLLTVTPTTFGPGETVLTIAVEGGGDGQLLFDSLFLESGAETIEVPVAARWAAPPPDALCVPRDGLLEELIASAPDGCIIRLEHGDHRLTRPLVADRPVFLSGPPSGGARLVGTAEGPVLRLSGAGPFLVHDVTFTREGQATGGGVQVDGGEAEFARCRFEGSRAGDGLLARGDSNVAVTDCHSVGNRGQGIKLADRAKGVLKGNVCRENGQNGIGVFDEAAPTLAGNTCEANAGSGLSLGGTAGGEATGNRCTRNRSSGIRVGDEASTTLAGNTCSENAHSGIGIGESAAPEVRSNTCARNEGHGIRYWGGAGGRATANVCRDNGRIGIYVTGSAVTELVGNTCEGNALDGIVVADDADAVITANVCRANRGWGVRVAASATADLEGNEVEENGAGGIQDLRPADPSPAG